MSDTDRPRRQSRKAPPGATVVGALRSGLYLLFQFGTVVPWAFLCVLCAPLPLSWRYKVTMGWPMNVWAARVILGIRHQVIGAENLPDGPAILLSKHQSTWETLFYPSYMPRELCYVFKRELLYLPFFGWGIRPARHDPHRSQAWPERIRAKWSARARSSPRAWIIMFPEGAFPWGARATTSRVAHASRQEQVRRSCQLP
ncbi:MAG: lysophospholipid acyltransferase family protein [Burkholderiaceae bacterium]